MAAVMLQVIPSYFAENSEKWFFISANTCKKYIVCNDYCVASHNDKICCVSSCKFHIILFGNFEDLLKKSYRFCLTCQHMDCLYTLFLCRFSGKGIAKSGQLFDNVQRAVDFIVRNKGVDRIPSIAKRGSWEKVEKTFLHLLSEDKNNADQWFSVCRKNWES